MEDYSKRPHFEKIKKNGQEIDLQYCGECAKFVPLWEGADRGDCPVMNVMVYNDWCCSCPDKFESIIGKQLSFL